MSILDKYMYAGTCSLGSRYSPAQRWRGMNNALPRFRHRNYTFVIAHTISVRRKLIYTRVYLQSRYNNVRSDAARSTNNFTIWKNYKIRLLQTTVECRRYKLRGCDIGYTNGLVCMNGYNLICLNHIRISVSGGTLYVRRRDFV